MCEGAEIGDRELVADGLRFSQDFDPAAYHAKISGSAHSLAALSSWRACLDWVHDVLFQQAMASELCPTRVLPSAPAPA